MAVAGLGNATFSRPLAACVLRGDKTEKCHDMLRIVESREITKFCYHGGRNDQADTPQCLIRPKHRKHAPGRRQFLDLPGKSLQTIGGFLDSVNIRAKALLVY